MLSPASYNYGVFLKSVNLFPQTDQFYAPGSNANTTVNVFKNSSSLGTYHLSGKRKCESFFFLK